MTIADALRAAAQEAELNSTQIAARVQRSEASARQYMAGNAVPSGDVLLRLMVEIPGFAQRLGFEPHRTMRAGQTS